MITRQLVGERIGAWLRHEITTDELVDWAENALQDAAFEGDATHELAEVPTWNSPAASRCSSRPATTPACPTADAGASRLMTDLATKRIVVTGGAGFLGTAVCQVLRGGRVDLLLGHGLGHAGISLRGRRGLGDSAGGGGDGGAGADQPRRR